MDGSGEITTGPPIPGAPWIRHGGPGAFAGGGTGSGFGSGFGTGGGGGVGGGGAGFPPPTPQARPSVMKSFLSRCPHEDRRLARFTEKVSLLVNNLLGVGFLKSSADLGFVITGGGMQSTHSPGPNDDSSVGVVVGCTWINTTTQQVWICLDNTLGAAVWRGPL